jgi:hypothetical protein
MKNLRVIRGKFYSIEGRRRIGLLLGGTQCVAVNEDHRVEGANESAFKYKTGWLQL